MNCLSSHYVHREINWLAYPSEASCGKMLAPLRSTAFQSSYPPIFFFIFILKIRLSPVGKCYK